MGELENISEIIRGTKEVLRIMDNYYVPETIKKQKVQELFRKVLVVNYSEIEVFKKEFKNVFIKLCADINEQAQLFLNVLEWNIAEARTLCNIILQFEKYVFDLQGLPWTIGRKITRAELINLRRIFRKIFHDYGVRSTPVTVILSGSLARGFSDYKWVQGSIPKPSDYDLPDEYRKVINQEISIHQELRAMLSDVDFLIINELVYNSVHKDTKITAIGTFRLGEKYDVGLGGSKILMELHKRLSTTTIGGLRNRWIGFAVVKDDFQYRLFLCNRLEVIKKLERKTGRSISMQDVIVLDTELIR